MKRIFLLCCIFLLFFNSANAALKTIGTATYNGAEYKLIWDDNNNGNSVVWLDYSNGPDIWSNQVSWASGLNGAGVLTYNIDSAYTVDWGTSSWRLPTTVDGPYIYGKDGTTTAGYNITSSEMGHLYYAELGNLGTYAKDGIYQTGWGLHNVGDFDNLITSWYWSGTEYANNTDTAWLFLMDRGNQFRDSKSGDFYGLAVRSGQVSAVPVPGAIWLLGSGLIGLVGFNRRNNNK